MIGSPTLSIVVPVYNVETYLRHCLDSLVGQTMKDIEIICVDDGSTDASPSIQQEYAARDARIIILSQPNAGQGAARNRALEIARAPYIMFCDSDDWYEPTMCEHMLAAIQSAPGVDYAACATHLHYEHGEDLSRSDAKYYKLKHRGLVELNDAALLSTDVSVCNKIFRREIIASHGIRFPEGIYYEDTAFYHLYALCSERAVYLPQKKLYHYRRRAGSTMSNTFDGISRRAADMLSVAEYIYEFMVMQEFLPERRHYYGRLYFELFTSALGFGREEADKRELQERADAFLRRTGLEFADDAELTYRRSLLESRILPGTTCKHCGGLITTKYKAHGVKHYFMGIPLHTNHHIPV